MPPLCSFALHTFLVSSSLRSASSTRFHGASGTCNFSAPLLFCPLLGTSDALSQLAGTLLEPLGLLLKLLGASWCLLGAFGSLLGPLGRLLGLLLGPPGGLLGASWGPLGASWGPLGDHIKKCPEIDPQNDLPGTYFLGPQTYHIGSRGLPRAPGPTPEKTKLFDRVLGPAKN